ncbi:MULTISPECIES: YcnI family protein [Phenylobacterium]|uniref:Uncharacterized protein YcnI n=1 Tax=Phenylobacterium koreense TaxID=266125 RepID=A0ABV2EH24_9CAUL
MGVLSHFRRSFRADASLIAGLALLALPSLACAHIVADPGTATAGAYQPVVFRVGHGCGAAATTAIRIEIPADMASARPQAKPGWRLEIERAGEKVLSITWRGELPDDQFDEFAILFKLPDSPGKLYFPTVQTCGRQETQWTEIPQAGERAAYPAPSLVIETKRAGEAPSHQH